MHIDIHECILILGGTCIYVWYSIYMYLCQYDNFDLKRNFQDQNYRKYGIIFKYISGQNSCNSDQPGVLNRFSD